VQYSCAQRQTFHAQRQTFHAQRQTFRAQAQTFRAQPQPSRAQPQTFRAQPQTFRAQPQTFPAQMQTFRALCAYRRAQRDDLHAQGGNSDENAKLLKNRSFGLDDGTFFKRRRFFSLGLRN
jgi:hypothetical protein